MNQSIYVLLVLAALAFLVGAFVVYIPFSPSSFLGVSATTYWRGAIGLLAFAITLLLVQIRDKP